MKFLDEVYFCFRFAMIMKANIEEGMWLPPFECSSKKVILHRKFIELAQEEIKRVKNLPGKATPLRLSSRPPKSVQLADPSTAIKGIAKKKAEKLSETVINGVGNFIAIIATPKWFADRAWFSIKNSLLLSFPHSLPKPINHKEAENHDLSSFGDDLLQKTKKVSNLSSYCDAQGMVAWICDEIKKLHIGSNYENNFCFYHDEISQMNHAETLDWMQSQWVLKN